MKNEKRKSIDSNKLRQKAEVLLNTKSTKLGSLYSEDELLKIVHELDVHRIELELQNEELLTAKSELHINSQKYIELYDFAPMAYITLSKTGEIININFKAAQILGKERSKLINSRFAFFVSNDTKQLFNQFLGDLFESKTEKTSEISLSLNDNSLKYFSITGIVPELGENYLISLIDITESKNFNKILLENKELMSKTQRIAHLGTWELDLFTEKLKWSDEVYLILGLQAQEFDVTLKLFLEFIHPDDLDMVTAAYFNSIDKDQYGYEIEHRIIRKNSNEIRYVYEKCEHIRNSKGEIIRSLGMVQDITERKFAEAELKKNKEQFGLAMDATNDGLWDWDVITGKVYYSPGYFRILGYQPNEFKSTIEIWKELLHPDDKQRALAYNDACVNNTIESIKVEFRMKAKDNTWRWILSRGTAVQRDKNGKALRMIGTHIDITHNKQRDLALKESENKYRELVENSPDAIVIYTKGIIVFANNQCLQLIGASNKEELLNKPILQFAHPDYHDIIKERMNKITAAGIVLPLIDEKLIRLDGSVVDVEIKSISILHENKLSVQLIIRDISERIENEKARKLAYKMLEESEKRFSLFMDYLPATVFIKDSENRLVYANKNMDTTLGASKWIGLNSYEIFDKETAARILTDDNRALEMGYEKTEETYLHIDGSMHHYETQKFLISDNDNNILLGGIATDLSERKKYEIQIRESRDRYWSLIELAVDGILTGNEEGFIIDANSAICSMFGKDKAEIIGKYIGDSIFTPESIKQSPFQFDKLKNGEVVVSERKVIRPDATEILIEMRSKMMPDGNYQSICRDITIRKQMEDELMQLNNKLERRVIERTEELLKSNISINNIRENYETFFNTIDDFLFVLDDKGNILHTNSTVNNRLGYTYKELLEKSYLFVHPEEYHEDAKRIMAEMLAGITDFCLIPMKTKSGDYIYAEIKVKQGIWNDKNVIFGVGKDISKIKLSEEKFSKVFYLNPSAAGINDLNTGIYIDVNEAFCNLFGYKKEEVIGKTAIELGIMSFESREKILIKTDYSGKIKNEETELKTKNGKIIHVILSADTINLHDKKMRFTAIQDITSRKETEILAKQLFYYTTSLNKIAEIIISYDNAQDILENSNRIIGETLQLDRAMIYDISFKKNCTTCMCEWQKKELHGIKSTKGIYNSIEMFSIPFNEIRETRKYIESHFDEVNEIFTQDESANIIHNQLKIKSLLWYPFAFDEHGYYLFVMNQIIEERKWTNEEIEFLESLLKQLNLALIKINLLEERKIAEEELIANKERFRTVADYTYNWEYWQNIEGNYIYVSPSCKRISGHTPSEFIQNSGLMLQIIYPEDLKVYQYFTEKSNMIKYDTNEIEYRIISSDRKIKWVSQVANLIYDESERCIGIRGSISDVTEKTMVKRLLKASEEKYRLISENITEGLFICSNGCFQYVNNAMCHIFGYDENELEGLKINHLIVTESREELDSFINQNNNSDKILKLEIECLKKDNTIIIAAIQLNYYFYQKLVYGVVHDITDKKQIQKNIFQAIVRTEENERAFFSKELHDGLGPLLSTIKLYLQWSERPNSKKNQQEAILKAEEILEEALTTVKEISNKLSPHLLTYYGINSAVQCFIDKQLETSSLKINFQSNVRRRFDKEIEVAIYRAIIECINNTIKHANAKNITIKINDSEKQLQIKYKDDGIGFDFEETLSLKKGLGLYNIQTRILSIDGKVKLQSKPGNGVKYSFVVNITNGIA